MNLIKLLHYNSLYIVPDIFLVFLISYMSFLCVQSTWLGLLSFPHSCFSATKKKKKTLQKRILMDDKDTSEAELQHEIHHIVFTLS